MSRSDQVARFSPGQRAVHWSVAALATGSVITALLLYVDPLSALVGRRALLRDVHLVCGYLLPVPIVAGLLSAAFRADAASLNRFTDDDLRWLRSSRARRWGRLAVGKFNAGQKLWAAFGLGSVAVLLVTGAAMADLFGWWPLRLRTGATFVHDWLALAFGVALLGHVRLGLERDALRGMVTGHVPRAWATRTHPAWQPDDEAVPSAVAQAEEG